MPWPRIRYLSGSGPVAGRDQWNAIELSVEGPAASPVGRRTGGTTHGAQTTRPAASPSITTAASTNAGHRRRLRGAKVTGAWSAAGAAVTGATVTGAGSTAGSSAFARSWVGVWGAAKAGATVASSAMPSLSVNAHSYPAAPRPFDTGRRC